mmetsp:Transcript_54391/g.129241  ORF Transcript_54391/g.129241 Transcript_54391/m.129241 type:complete len:167 (-) Transcript_54391:124-624(-)
MAVVMGASQWSSGICDFTDECGFCCYASWCPCLAYGELSAKMSRGRAWNSGDQIMTQAGYCGVGCFMSFLVAEVVFHFPLRDAIRQGFGIPGDSCNDICCVLCCSSCVATQEYKQMNTDPARMLQPGGGTVMIIQQHHGVQGVQHANPVAVPVATLAPVPAYNMGK